MRRDELRIAALEERAPLRGDRFGVLEVLVEQGARVAVVQAVDVMRVHPCQSTREAWKALLAGV